MKPTMRNKTMKIWNMHRKCKPFSCFMIAGFCVVFGLSSCSSEKKVEQATGKEDQQVPTLPVVAVQSKALNVTLELPGQLVAFQDVPIHAKVEGFISAITVDRGSRVHKGQRMIEIEAPEVDDKVEEAQSKISAADAAYRQSQSTLQGTISKQVEAKAKYDADQLTYDRLLQASKTPGAIAQNEVDLQQKTVEQDKARIQAIQAEVAAARNLVQSQNNNVIAARKVANALKSMRAYLTIRAPFDGVVTERNVHEGSIVAVDSNRQSSPLVRVQQKSILRLVVAVPEESVAGITVGTKIPFTVPAFVGRDFQGTVARLGYALDTNTRTMPVELNVSNADGALEPGMFATVSWTITRPKDSLFLPQSAVNSDLKGTFVVRIANGISERVRVRRGQSMGEMVEIVGKLKAGDLVALKATDEIRSGTHIVAKLADPEQIKESSKHASSGGE